MAADGMDVTAVLRSWREQGIDRTAPLRYHQVEALHRRALRHTGATRRLLDARLAQWIGHVANPAPAPGIHAPSGPPSESQSPDTTHPHEADTPGPIAGLATELAQRSLVRVAPTCGDAGQGPQDPELLVELRRIWSDALARNRMRQSLVVPSGEAGPLNSTTLVHRALELMRAGSPGYLQHFLAYADTLSWLERMGNGEPAPDRTAPRRGGTRPPRAKPRGRKS